jgi:hypothetical protein
MRLMKSKNGFPKVDNRQASVDTTSRLIVIPRVSRPPTTSVNRPRHGLCGCHVLPDTLLVESGLVSEAAVTTVEPITPGLTILAALPREPHGRTVAQFEKPSDPPAPPPEASFAERMRHRTSTTAGRALTNRKQPAGWLGVRT